VIEIQFPSSSDTLACRLDRNHRNSPTIQKLYKWLRDHIYTTDYHTMENEVELADSELPCGPRPTWVDCPENTDTADILEFVSKLEAVTQYKEVTVITRLVNSSEAQAWCGEKEGWQCREYTECRGSEWQACVVIDLVGPETLSRAANLLVLVTGSDRTRANKLRPAAAHASPDHECEELADCPYRGVQLLDTLTWPGWNGVRDPIWWCELEWEKELADSPDWPDKLSIKLLSDKPDIDFDQSNVIEFHFKKSGSLELFTKEMQNRFGCIELPENCDIKIILLVYHNHSFFGSIPNNGEEEEAPTAANLAGNLT